MSRLRDLRGQWRERIRWTVAQVWTIDRRSCLVVAAASILAASITPFSVMLMAHIVGILRTRLIEGNSAGEDPWLWILVAGALSLTGIIAGAVRKYAQNRLSDSVTLEVRSQLLARAAQLDLQTLEDRAHQNELSLLTKDSGKSLVTSANELINLAAYALRVVSLAGIMFAIEPWGTLAVLLAAGPLIGAGSLLARARHRLRSKNAETQRWSNYYSRHLTQYNLAPEVRVLDLAPWIIEQTKLKIDELQKISRRIDRMELGFKLATSIISIVLLLLAIRRVAEHTVAGTLEIERFVAFWLAAWRLARDAASLAGSSANAAKAWVEAIHLQAFLDRREPGIARPLGLPNAHCGEIVLKDVSFRYPRAKTDALHRVSLRIAEGETVAIVGHNGAGKTTLAKLIAGLYQPSAGEIRFGGLPQSELELDALHKQMAIVMQDPIRLEATAAENIALGDRARLWGRPQEIRRVASNLGGDTMLMGLPEGYDTRLGKQFGDHELSGGQWQKLAIMRAMAREPRIVLLDEPTSGIDVNSEREILAGMRKLVAGRTAILISHRFATVSMADRIIVIEGGQIAEQGTHLELLAAGGIYAAMWRTQTRQAA